MAAPAGGSYRLGFQLTPLTADGDLDTSGDFRGGPHPVEEDPLYKMAVENRDGGNKMVKNGDYEAAIGRYSEMIMQTRSLENETDVLWTEEARNMIRQLRAAAYLNLSLCFLKTQQWVHASNTATRAMQGDKDPPDPKEDVLSADKKAKALFRRAQAQREGFSNLEKAVADLKQAAELVPDDKAIQQELQKVQREQAKAAKAADKKLSGFLKGKGDGLFDDSLRPSSSSAPPKPVEPVKVSDGLWVMPEDERLADAQGDGVDYDELGREIAELRDEKPEVFAALREKVKAYVEEQVADHERSEAAIAAHENAEAAAPEAGGSTAGAVAGEAVASPGEAVAQAEPAAEDAAPSAESTATAAAAAA